MVQLDSPPEGSRHLSPSEKVILPTFVLIMVFFVFFFFDWFVFSLSFQGSTFFARPPLILAFRVDFDGARPVYAA